MAIDVAFQVSMSPFPDATAALGPKTWAMLLDSVCLMPLWLQILHVFVFGSQ